MSNFIEGMIDGFHEDLEDLTDNVRENLEDIVLPDDPEDE